MKRYFVVLFAILAAVAAFATAPNYSGTWTLSTSGSPHTLVLQVNQTFLTGTADGVAISKGYADNTCVQFVVARNGTRYSYKGGISGSQLNLQENEMAPNGSRRNLVFSRAQ